jgi:hypothetical protein
VQLAELVFKDQQEQQVQREQPVEQVLLDQLDQPE